MVPGLTVARPSGAIHGGVTGGAPAAERLVPRWPGRALRFAYRSELRGRMTGRVETALTAWGRVPARAPLAPAPGAIDRARLALDHGRLAIAEASIEPLFVSARGEAGLLAAQLADQVDLFTGRDGRR